MRNVTVFGDGPFKGVTKDKAGHKDGEISQYNECPYTKRERHQGCTLTGNLDSGTERRQSRASQGERPQEKPNFPTLLCWTSGLQSCEKINFCYLNTQSVNFIMEALEN